MVAATDLPRSFRFGFHTLEQTGMGKNLNFQYNS
jgi:hypothetical protein